MTKKPPPRRRHLSKEDHALWEHTASSLEPLSRKRHRVHPANPETETEPQVRTAAKQAQHHAIASAEGRTTEPKIVPPKVEAAKAPALNTFDRRAAKKLRQGHFEIEARIDLHGMRQVEAHTALRRFLFSCHSRGLRWVLVITGKGGRQRRNEEESVGFGSSSERGVLKRNVPMWLAEPELRAIVVSFTAAAIQHGGDGALYIQLRNPDKILRR
ncbi:MAG: Smr/MutS family protein [Hyphomicrobium sp.]|jgi:DNA-nicking Smr family endonuclease